MIDISRRKQAPSQYDQFSSDEDDLDLSEHHEFYWEKGEDPTEPISDSESGEIPTSTTRTRRRSEGAMKRLATDEIIPQSMNYSPSDDEISTLSHENSLHDSCVTLELELGPSEQVSPLGDNTPTFFTGKLPSLEPPLHTPPSARRSGSSTDRGQKPSSERTVRRTFSFDYKLQQKSQDQSDRVQENQDAKPGHYAFLNLKPRRHAFMNKPSPRRGRSMDFSYRSDQDSLSVRTDTGVIVAPINDDRKHNRTRSGAEKLLRNQESFGSLSSCGEKSNRTIRRLSYSSIGERTSRSVPRGSSRGSSLSSRERPNSTMRRVSLGNSSMRRGSVGSNTMRRGSLGGETSNSSMRRGSVGSSTMRRGSVGSNAMRRGSVGSNTMRRGSVGSNTMRRGSVGSSTMRRGSVGSSTMRRGSLGSDTMRRGSLGGETANSTMRRGSVGSNTMRRGSLGSSTMRRGSLGSEKSNSFIMRRGSLSSIGEKPDSTMRRGSLGSSTMRRGSLGSEKSNSFIMRRGSLSSIGEKPDRAMRRCSRSQRNQRNSDSYVENVLQMEFTSVEGTDGCCVIKCRSRSIEVKKSQSQPNKRGIERSRSFDLSERSTSSTMNNQREIKLERPDIQEMLEAKMAKRETKKNQEKLKSPSSLHEISAIYNQAHERHRRRYSAKMVGDESADEDEYSV